MRRRKGQKKVPSFEDMKMRKSCSDFNKNGLMIESKQNKSCSRNYRAKESAGASVIIDHQQSRITSDELPGLYF